MESESNGKIAFLDTQIHHHEDGNMSTTVYRKKTHTDKYLYFDSHTQWHTKILWQEHSLTEQTRYVFHPDRVKEEVHITTALKRNGYPLAVIKRSSKKVLD